MMTLSRVALLVLLTASSDIGAKALLEVEETSPVLRSLFEESSLSEQQHEPRELSIFGTSTYCSRSWFDDDNYSTKTVFFPFIARWRGDPAGTCASQCTNVCDHQLCIDDFILTNDDNDCECVREGAESRCGANTACDNDNCVCLAGYEGIPTVGCTDIDECALDDSPCGANTVCANMPVASFTCTCAAGYTGDPLAGCVDINECDTASTCGPNGTCENTEGSYTCTCDPGFISDPAPTGDCRDVDECLSVDCGPNSVCQNTPGTFQCGCASGYSSTGTPPTAPCTDIDECTTTNLCGANSGCTNSDGSFSCTCNNGYIGNPPDELCVGNSCTLAGKICGTNAECVTSGAVVECQCPSGFNGDPLVSCNDIDECDDGANGATACPLSTQDCFNTPGSFNCLITEFERCPSGEDNTCAPGLTCNRESGSEPALTCCATFRVCNAGDTCCNGAYIEGEDCPSTDDDDCEGDLECGRTLTSERYRCCDDTRTSPIFGFKICQ